MKLQFHVGTAIAKTHTSLIERRDYERNAGGARLINYAKSAPCGAFFNSGKGTDLSPKKERKERKMNSLKYINIGEVSPPTSSCKWKIKEKFRLGGPDYIKMAQSGPGAPIIPQDWGAFLIGNAKWRYSVQNPDGCWPGWGYKLYPLPLIVPGDRIFIRKNPVLGNQTHILHSNTGFLLIEEKKGSHVGIYGEPFPAPGKILPMGEDWHLLYPSSLEFVLALDVGEV